MFFITSTFNFKRPSGAFLEFKKHRTRKRSNCECCMIDNNNLLLANFNKKLFSNNVEEVFDIETPLWVDFLPE